MASSASLGSGNEQSLLPHAVRRVRCRLNETTTTISCPSCCQHRPYDHNDNTTSFWQEEQPRKGRRRGRRRRGRIRLPCSSPTTRSTTKMKTTTSPRYFAASTSSCLAFTYVLSFIVFMIVVDGWMVPVPKMITRIRTPTLMSLSRRRIDHFLQQQQASIQSHLRLRPKRKQHRNILKSTCKTNIYAGAAVSPAGVDGDDVQQQKRQRQVQTQQSVLLDCTTRTELGTKLDEISNLAADDGDVGKNENWTDRFENHDLHDDDVNVVVDHERPYSSVHINVTTTAFRRLANIVYVENKKHQHEQQQQNRYRYRYSSSSSSIDTASSLLLPKLIEIVATRIVFETMEEKKFQQLNQNGQRTIVTTNNDQNCGTSYNNRMTNNIHPVCLSDTLQALSLLSRIKSDDNNDSVYNTHHHNHNNHHHRSQSTSTLQSHSTTPSDRATYFRPLGRKIIELFSSMDPGDIYRIGPTRLVQTIQSMNELGLFLRGVDTTHQAAAAATAAATATATATTAATSPVVAPPPTSTTKFLTTMLQRLIKPDAISKLPPKMVVHFLLTLLDVHRSVVVVQSVHDSDDGGDVEIIATTETETEILVLGLIRSLMRRLIKKPKIRREIPTSDLCRIFTAIQKFERRYFKTRDIRHENEEEEEDEEGEGEDNNQAQSFDDIKAETDKFVDSILKSILAAKQYQSPVDKTEEDETISEINPSSRSTTTTTTTTDPWTSTQFSSLLSSWLNVSPNVRTVTTLNGILDVCMEEKIIEKCSFWKLSDLALVLTSGGQYDDVETKKAFTELIVNEHPDFILGMENQFQKLVMTDSASRYSNVPTDETICKILRWYVVVQRRQRQEGARENVSLVKAATTLFSDRRYISNCKLDHLNTFLWFLGASSSSPSSLDVPGDKMREGAILCIAERLVEIESFESSSCTPGLSSATLAGFTSAVASRPFLSKSELIHHMSLQIFDSFGPILLLSRSLSSSEASKALRAYADAVTFRYDDHKGIIDHLVVILASSPVSNKCTTRQLSESLWACGKLLAWESNKNPPYIEHALLLADELASRTEEMTSEDSAQAIWALGKLKVREKELVSVLASRTIQPDLQPGFAEISNILWGMCQVQFRDVRIIYALVERTKVLIGTNHNIKSKEASSILYCLANLGFRDEQVFESLANKIVDQIDSTSAQSVANTLYAFRTVQLRPPTKILNSWAKENLGIIPLTGIVDDLEFTEEYEGDIEQWTE